MIKDDAILVADEINSDIYPDVAVRFVALILDGLIPCVVFLPFYFFEGYGKNIHLYSIVFNLIVLFFYHVYLVQRYGGTPGKLILGIKIIKLNTQPITWREAILRYSVQLIDLIITSALGVYAINMADNAHYVSLDWLHRAGYLSSLYPDLVQIKMSGRMFMQIHLVTQFLGLWTIAEVIAVFTNHRKRAVHDFIAGTVVVKIGYAGNNHAPTIETEQQNIVD